MQRRGAGQQRTQLDRPVIGCHYRVWPGNWPVGALLVRPETVYALCVMGRRGPLPTPLQRYVIALYLRGELATLEEGAAIAGVTRSRIRCWLKAAEIDWQRRRLHFIARHRRIAVAVSEGRTIARPTKREQRRLATLAKAKWDKQHEPAPEAGSAAPSPKSV